MTAQEQQMLQNLTDRINGTQLAEKDPEAEQYLAQTLGRNPDALYILTQTTLVQGYALEQAQKQLADARAQVEQLRQQPPPEPKHPTSFLGSIFGSKDDKPEPARQPPPPPQPQYAPVPNYPPAGSFYAQGNQPYGQPQYAPPQYGQPQYGQPQYQPQYAQPQSGGFLRSAMQTATGVAAGALAFEGIESLMHGFGGHSGGGQGFGSFGEGGGGRPEEVINNYYGDSSPREHSDHLSSDIEDRRADAQGDAHGFADTSISSDSDVLDSNGDDTPDDDSPTYDTTDDASDNDMSSSDFDDSNSSSDDNSGN